jgi:hypothetical protein
MSQEQPGQVQPVPPFVPGATPSPAGAPPAAAATVPQAPPPTPAPSTDTEAKLKAYEEQLNRLKGTQSAEARRFAQNQAQLKAERDQLAAQAAQMQQQLQSIQMQNVPEEQRAAVQYQQLQQQLEQERQNNAALQWQSYLSNMARQHTSQGVPEEVLAQAANQAQRPDEAAYLMQNAAANYWREQALRAQQPPQSAPVAQPQPQSMQRPIAPSVTSHTQAAQPSSLEDDLQGLAEVSRKQGKNTVYEALKRLEQGR